MALAPGSVQPLPPVPGQSLSLSDDWDPPQPNRFLLPLSQIGEWPTHKRFRDAGAGRVALDEETLEEVVNLYLGNPAADGDERKQFIADEITYVDGSAGKRTGDYLLSILP